MIQSACQRETVVIATCSEVLTKRMLDRYFQVCLKWNQEKIALNNAVVIDFTRKASKLTFNFASETKLLKIYIL